MLVAWPRTGAEAKQVNLGCILKVVLGGLNEGSQCESRKAKSWTGTSLGLGPDTVLSHLHSSQELLRLGSVLQLRKPELGGVTRSPIKSRCRLAMQGETGFQPQSDSKAESAYHKTRNTCKAWDGQMWVLGILHIFLREFNLVAAWLKCSCGFFLNYQKY